MDEEKVPVPGEIQCVNEWAGKKAKQEAKNTNKSTLRVRKFSKSSNVFKTGDNYKSVMPWGKKGLNNKDLSARNKFWKIGTPESKADKTTATKKQLEMVQTEQDTPGLYWDVKHIYYTEYNTFDADILTA